MRSRINDTVSPAQVEDLAGGIPSRSLQLQDHGPKCAVRGIELHLERLRLRTILPMLQRCAEACFCCNESAQDIY